jgi:hypothetical protein
MPTWEEISKMNDEEIRAENNRLAKKVITYFVATIGLKWAIVIGLNEIGRRLNKKQPIPAKVWIHK